jgi:hypothetical protein
MKRALVTLTLTGISAGIVWFSSAPALAGPGPTPAIERAWAVAVDKSGNVYMSNGAAYVRRINPEGALSIYAGNGMTGFSGNGGASTSAELTAEGIAVDPNGNLLIAGGGAVRKVTPAKIISTVAGTGKPGFSGDGGLATAAQITAHGVAVDTSGNVYIAGDSVVRKVTPSGVISTFAGTGETGFSGDGGLATSARMSRLVNVAAGAGAVVYISDFDYERVRKVTPDGVIQTVAGTGERGFGGDGGPGNSARLNGPMGMTEDASGNLFIADGNNGRVRKLTPRGIITTVLSAASSATPFRNSGETAGQPRPPGSAFQDPWLSTGMGIFSSPASCNSGRSRPRALSRPFGTRTPALQLQSARCKNPMLLCTPHRS